MVAGAVLFAVAYTGFALAGGDLAVLAACFALAGEGIGCVKTVECTAVATTAPAQVRGSAFGVLAGVKSPGNLIASSVAGLLWTAIAPAAGFTYLAVCMVVAVTVLLGTATAPPHATRGKRAGAACERRRSHARSTGGGATGDLVGWSRRGEVEGDADGDDAALEQQHVLDE